MENVKNTLKRCVDCGINTAQMRGDAFILRVMRELQNEGVPLQWMAQTAPEFGDFEGGVNRIAARKPIAIYLQGTETDRLFKLGAYDEINRRLGIIRKTGVAVGLGTHMPEVLLYAQEHGFDCDYYQPCVYNLSKVARVSSAITNRANEGEPFDEEDIPAMYAVIRQMEKPCLAFKILGATRRCDTPDHVRSCFVEAFYNIKPQDAVIVGMFPQQRDQVAENARYTSQAIGLAQGIQ
nr:hypothetical protein [bacterium]